MEKTKPINVFESDYNTLTLIAQKEGFIHPEGHASAGKMIASKTLQHVLKVYAGAVQ